MAGFSSEPPPVFVHPSSLDLQCVGPTAARGHRRSHPLTQRPLISIQYYLTLRLQIPISRPSFNYSRC